MSVLYGWVIQIAAIVAFIVLIEIVLPSGKLKKVIDLVLGFILIISILNPLISVFKGKVNINDLFQSAEFNMDEIDVNTESKALENTQNKQVITVFKKNVIGHITETAVTVTGIDPQYIKTDIVVDEDIASQSFGMIRQVFIEITSIASDATQKTAIPSETGTVNVQPVTIDPIAEPSASVKGADASSTGTKADQHIVELLKDKICALYEVDRNNIIISINKGG